MRHQKHRHLLGVKKEHRVALVATLASALIKHRRIQTTLAKAKAVRPFVERAITLAKKAAQTEDTGRKLHYRRLAAARLRDPQAVRDLFDERASEFLNRTGGYTRIYKLVSRISDATPMALIELIPAGDEGYKKSSRRKGGAKGKKKSGQTPASAAPVAAEAAAAPEAPAADAPAAVAEVPAPEKS
ncbi:MAG: 50S ribosomal protein L17 [Opitutales bacterium]|jgi:large subunit ribosomal protein L17